MNILSIDWDYFAPDIFQFDWGHMESSFFLEPIWNFRSHDISLINGERALDKIKPTGYIELLQKIITISPAKIMIAESHSSIYEFIKYFKCKNLTVWNFDQHHDLGYHERATLQCDNWASIGLLKGLIKEYKLIYPKWRKEIPEKLPWDITPIYDVPDDLPGFVAVFICRSGAWMPTWCDDKWLEFIHYWKNNYPDLWNDKGYCEFALKKRSPSFEEAVKLANQMHELLKIGEKNGLVKTEK
jgi:hypothetical protein